MYQIISIAAVVAYFVPLAIILVKKAWGDPFFRLFAIYWCVGGIINTVYVIPGMPRTIIYHTGLFYNILDIPFVLCILHYTSSYTFIKRTATVAIAIFGIIQVTTLVQNRLTYDALTYPLGFGVLMVLVVIAMEIIRYMQKIEHSTRQNAKMFIYGALLFEYATFVVIYIFDYVINSDTHQDSYIVYYLSSMVAILIASCGFLMQSIRAERKSLME